jgi:hypothetical protein
VGLQFNPPPRQQTPISLEALLHRMEKLEAEVAALRRSKIEEEFRKEAGFDRGPFTILRTDIYHLPCFEHEIRHYGTMSLNIPRVPRPMSGSDPITSRVVLMLHQNETP